MLFLDIKECEDPNVCAPNADCKDVPGSYKCTCKKGYVGGGNNKCKSKSYIVHHQQTPQDQRGELPSHVVLFPVGAFSKLLII